MMTKVVKFFLDRPLWLAILGGLFLAIIFVAWFVWRGARIAKLEAQEKSLEARLKQVKIDATLAKTSEARDALLQQARQLNEEIKVHEVVMEREAKTYDETIQAVKDSRSWQDLDKFFGGKK